MRDLKISYGNSRQARFWSNKTITFEELCDRLKTPIRTSETAQEYPKLPKKERDALKDKGGFVAGHLRDNRRQRDKVACRSMLVYDLDGITPDFLADIRNKIPNAACFYTTHSHLPERPRARVLIPVTRDMTSEEFNAVARYYAADWHFLDMLDPCSFSPHQLMYWPSCPSNGEYLFGVIDGAWLNPDDVLKEHTDWRDYSLLPTTPKEGTVRASAAKQKDPYEKRGIVGLFCRAYTISEAIEEFLPDIYAPTANMTDRYDFIPGEGSAGVVVYGDKFAYSHHATDPAGGKLCNAFDLVRIHKFGDDDSDNSSSTSCNRSNAGKGESSYSQMCSFAAGLDRVKVLSVKERAEAARSEFSPLRDSEKLRGSEKLREGTELRDSTKLKDMDNESSMPNHAKSADELAGASSKQTTGKSRNQSQGISSGNSPGSPPGNSQGRSSDAENEENAEDPEAWLSGLSVSRKGVIEDTLDNLVHILRHDPNLSAISFNRHRDGIDANLAGVDGRQQLPWEQVKSGWNDSDYASLKVYLSKCYGIYSPTKTKDAILAVAAERSYHPIREYLEALTEWDGIPRVDTLFIDYFGADDTPYTRAVSRKSMVAAVARIYHPGTKFDFVPILYGPQGIGKSTFYAKLAGNWFSDSLTLTDMKDKSGPEKLQGYWILELGELAGMRKADIETVKSFISRTDDKYRASYGVNVESHPRQCIIVGSTNAEDGFLRDITGNRRFWPVHVYGTAKRHSWEMTREDIEQIWAETLVKYQLGENLYLEGEESEQAALEQDTAMETDEREGLVRRYLDTKIPENWSEKTIYERRTFLNDKDLINEEKGTVLRDYVCNLEIWSECFGKDPGAMKSADSYAIAAIMRKIEGWKKTDASERRSYSLYGRQRGYKRSREDTADVER